MEYHGNIANIPNYEWVKYIVTLRRDRTLESWFDCIPKWPYFRLVKITPLILAILIGNRWENDDMPWILVKEYPLIN